MKFFDSNNSEIDNKDFIDYFDKYRYLLNNMEVYTSFLTKNK